MYANHLGFQERTGKPIETDVLLTRARHLAKGIVRTDGKWMAGFYFNSALFRISAVYHRFLKIFVGREGDVGDLRPLAEAQYRELKRQKWENDNLRASHGQVTDLKHSQKGIYHGRRTGAGMRNVVAAVGELLDLVEAWV